MNGQCLCGAVRLAAPDEQDIGACHCGSCRRWGGGPLLAVHCGPGVEWQGAEQVTEFASSPWARRAFCSRCGTHLYYKLLATGEYFVPVGLFESNDFRLTSQIYIDKKPGYYAFANETPTLTEQQFIEQFAPPGPDAGA